ncbi:MAG: hypothetical protein WDM88_11470 [Galbitalea sp.]
MYWNASPWFAPATAWTPATWTTPAIPAGYDGIDFGLNLFSLGTLEVDDFAIANAGAGASAPVTTATVSPASPNGNANWYITTAPTVTLSTPDTGTATQIQYSLDGGTSWLPYTAPVTIAAGTSTFSYRSTTALQTEATHTIPFSVDLDAPTVTPVFDGATRTWSATAADATSGLATIEQRVPGGAWSAYAGPTAIGNQSLSLEFEATDLAGNVSAIAPLTAGAITTATVSPAAPEWQGRLVHHDADRHARRRWHAIPRRSERRPADPVLLRRNDVVLIWSARRDSGRRDHVLLPHDSGGTGRIRAVTRADRRQPSAPS